MRVAAGLMAAGFAWGLASAALAGPAGDGVVVKAVLKAPDRGRNLLAGDRWVAWKDGFRREGEAFVCDNGADAAAQRGASQTVQLNQTVARPIVAVAFSKAEGVGGTSDGDYSLYLDLVYNDGTPLWGQIAPFPTGTSDWQRREVVVIPAKPVRSLAFHMLLRRHSGKASFRDPQLYVPDQAAGACAFDAVPVTVQATPEEGFQVRDAAAGGDFVRIEKAALGLRLETSRSTQADASFLDATITDTTGADRAVTLIYAVRLAEEPLSWLADPRQSQPVQGGLEYMNASQFRVGANGRLSRYPLGAVATARQGVALGIDMARPAFYRIGYNAPSQELFVAYDLGLCREKPSARVRLCRFGFQPRWGFRAALARYYELFADHFARRIAEGGLWMPFARISQVKDWQDFGFRFKEGDNETKWDDEHGMLTFRYTEPMTWWMRMDKSLPRTIEAALAEARRLADKGDARARSLFTSGFHNAAGQFPARLLDTPWCDGAVWSMNSMPGVAGEITDFKNKWSPALRERLYGPKRVGGLDGEYVDSAEGYATDDLDFRRDHFAAADTPLTFSLDGRRVAIFKGLVAFEYVRAIARDVHAMGKHMMANGVPTRLCWPAALLDVMGTETDWNRNGTWRPMSDADMLYRRAMCKAKPYCFLMNTRFEDFSATLVEKYMKRCLAYGMFPGFFSHNASQGQYFTRPDLYDRDRPLFKKYVPLCKRVAEAGWEPITQAASSDERIHVERFGEQYLTVFNDSDQRRTATITLTAPAPAACTDLLTGKPVQWSDGKAEIALDGEDVAVVLLR